MQQSSNLAKLHLWCPNLFELKGGIQVYLQDLLQALAEEFPGRYFVFDKLDNTRPKDKFNSNKFSFSFSGNVPGFWRTPHFALSSIAGYLINRPNLILCCHMNFSPVAFWLHRFTGIPYWIIVYGVDAWMVQDKWKIKALHAAEKIVSISGYTRDRLVKEQNIPPDKIRLLPVTFDASRFQIAPKPQYLLNRYGLKAEQPIILTVARLDASERSKGYDRILQALPEIRRSMLNVHYILVGKGTDIPRIEQLINQLSLQDCVTLTGFVPDDELCAHYNLSDVFAMPSIADGFGIVYLEALACGKPTLGGNQDGAIDALCQGEVGVLVDPHDVGAIAKSIIQILQGTYPNPVIYQPEILRQKIIETYGIEVFKRTLAKYLVDFFD